LEPLDRYRKIPVLAVVDEREAIQEFNRDLLERLTQRTSARATSRHAALCEAERPLRNVRRAITKSSTPNSSSKYINDIFLTISRYLSQFNICFARFAPFTGFFGLWVNREIQQPGYRDPVKKLYEPAASSQSRRTN
jgi:hypothetical protein